MFLFSDLAACETLDDLLRRHMEGRALCPMENVTVRFCFRTSVIKRDGKIQDKAEAHMTKLAARPRYVRLLHADHVRLYVDAAASTLHVELR